MSSGSVVWMAGALVWLGGCVPGGHPVDVEFVARVGGQEAACGTSYGPLGVDGSIVSLLDLRAYVSGLTVDGAGSIDDEDPWQSQGVALLDFEDGSAGCEAAGNVDTRKVVHAHTVSEGGLLEFDLGIPESLNHVDPAQMVSPLNVPSMFWGWTAGFRFFKLDLATTGQPTGWLVHVGSAGCAGVTGASAVCTESNRLHVSLDGWTPDRKVVIDLGALLAGADLDHNTESTGPGCMSEPDDPECVPVFAALGLPLDDGPATPQTVFSLE